MQSPRAGQECPSDERCVCFALANMLEVCSWLRFTEAQGRSSRVPRTALSVAVPTGDHVEHDAADSPLVPVENAARGSVSERNGKPMSLSLKTNQDVFNAAPTLPRR